MFCSSIANHSLGAKNNDENGKSTMRRTAPVGDAPSVNNIHKFVLSQLRINMEGAQAIAKMLNDQMNLSEIHLIDTGLDCETLTTICKSFEESE